MATVSKKISIFEKELLLEEKIHKKYKKVELLTNKVESFCDSMKDDLFKARVIHNILNKAKSEEYAEYTYTPNWTVIEKALKKCQKGISKKVAIFSKGFIEKKPKKGEIANATESFVDSMNDQPDFQRVVLEIILEDYGMYLHPKSEAVLNKRIALIREKADAGVASKKKVDTGVASKKKVVKKATSDSEVGLEIVQSVAAEVLPGNVWQVNEDFDFHPQMQVALGNQVSVALRRLGSGKTKLKQQTPVDVALTGAIALAVRAGRCEDLNTLVALRLQDAFPKATVHIVQIRIPFSHVVTVCKVKSKFFYADAWTSKPVFIDIKKETYDNFLHHGKHAGDRLKVTPASAASFGSDVTTYSGKISEFLPQALTTIGMSEDPDVAKKKFAKGFDKKGKKLLLPNSVYGSRAFAKMDPPSIGVCLLKKAAGKVVYEKFQSLKYDKMEWEEDDDDMYAVDMSHVITEKELERAGYLPSHPMFVKSRVFLEMQQRGN